MTDPVPWWVEHPERLHVEERELESLGGSAPVLNERMLADYDVRQYTVAYRDHYGNAYDLTVTYPDLYPYFAPVVASEHDFGAHQEPSHGILCLTRGGTAAWDVGDSAAGLIRDQMPLLLADRTDIATEEGSNHSEEESQPATQCPAAGNGPTLPHVEAVAGYYNYELSAGIRVDGAWSPVAADGGTLVLGVDGYQPGGFRGTVLSVADCDGNILARADPEIVDSDLYPAQTRIEGRWVRLSGPPPGPEPDSVLAAASVADEPLARIQSTRGPEAKFDVVGIVFEDDLRADVPTGTVERGDAWMFIVRPTTNHSAPPPKRHKNSKGGRYTPPTKPQPPQLVRGIRAGETDIFVRVPSLAPLRDRQVALFGIGGIGAPSSVEFGKAGLGVLHAVERDHLDPGNSVRWPYGYGMAGLHKLHALGAHLIQQWPYTRTALSPTNIGAAPLSVRVR